MLYVIVFCHVLLLSEDGVGMPLYYVTWVNLFVEIELIGHIIILNCMHKLCFVGIELSLEL